MEIRPVKLADIETALTLVNTEGWDYAKEEIERELLLNPGGSFFFADPEPIGIITTLFYGRTGVIGHLVVSRNARGRKVGQSLLTHALGYLDDKGAESILLYATPEGERLYRKHGFSVRGIARAVKAVNDGEFDHVRGPHIARTVPEDLVQIIDMDAKEFGDDRSKLIRHLYREFPQHCYKLEENNQITGYVLGRESSVACDLGPWGCTSRNTADAGALFGTCLKSMGRGAVFFGVFEENKQAWETVNRLHIIRAWPVQFMVRGHGRYTVGLGNVFGIVGFELG